MATPDPLAVICAREMPDRERLRIMHNIDIVFVMNLLGTDAVALQITGERLFSQIQSSALQRIVECFSDPEEFLISGNQTPVSLNTECRAQGYETAEHLGHAPTRGGRVNVADTNPAQLTSKLLDLLNEVTTDPPLVMLDSDQIGAAITWGLYAWQSALGLWSYRAGQSGADNLSRNNSSSQSRTGDCLNAVCNGRLPCRKMRDAIRFL